MGDGDEGFTQWCDDTEKFAHNANQYNSLVLARQDIECLRRWYAVATDKLGRVDDADAQSQGLQIYHRIFMPDAQIQVTKGGRTVHSGTGPDAWADVARNALRDYEATQHLIGTQLVTFTRADFDAQSGQLSAGVAQMSSYLQAWHAWPDRRLRLVLGTYLDTAVLTAIGWQIRTMNLVYSSEEQRMLDSTG